MCGKCSHELGQQTRTTTKEARARNAAKCFKHMCTHRKHDFLPKFEGPRKPPYTEGMHGWNLPNLKLRNPESVTPISCLLYVFNTRAVIKIRYYADNPVFWRVFTSKLELNPRPKVSPKAGAHYARAPTFRKRRARSGTPADLGRGRITSIMPTLSDGGSAVVRIFI